MDQSEKFEPKNEPNRIVHQEAKIRLHCQVRAKLRQIGKLDGFGSLLVDSLIALCFDERECRDMGLRPLARTRTDQFSALMLTAWNLYVDQRPACITYGNITFRWCGRKRSKFVHAGEPL